MIQPNLERIFNICLYGIVIMPILLIATAGGTKLMASGIALALVALSWVGHKRRWGHFIPQKVWDFIVLAFVGVSVLRLLVSDVSVLEEAIQLLLILTCVRLFSRLSVREDFQVFVLSFITLAAATTVNEDLVYGIVFSVYVLAGTFTLAVFHLRNELLERPRMAFRSPPRLDRPYALVLVTMSAGVLFFSLALFFVFPRVGLGFFAPQDRDGQSMVGFSESVELGGHGLVRDNPMVVLRVEFPEGRPKFSEFHWRMLSFDHYDGKSWSRTLDDSDAQHINWRRPLDDIYPSQGEPVLLQMYLEPLDTTLLPTLFPTQSIKLGTPNITMPIGPRSGRITLDSYNDVRHTIPSNVGVPYMVWVAEPRTKPRDNPLEAAPAAFVQLPSLSDEFGTLATQAADGATAPQEVAANIERFLETSYSYTTDLPKVGDSPVEDFLFVTRRGHCEYFATAATLLLRQNGVPARIVNGFYGGRWNNVGNYWAVRQGDAHSWVEYFDPNVGWLKLDPTPSSELQPPNPLLDVVRKTLDASKLIWTKWVIEYDLAAQIDLLRSAADAIQPGPQDKSDEDSKFIAKPILIAVVVGSFIVVFVVWLLRRRRARKDPIQSVFDTIEKAASRQGMPRRVDEGPAAFLDRVDDRFEIEDIKRFKAKYLATRFGGGEVDLNLLHTLAKNIVKQIKTSQKETV